MATIRFATSGVSACRATLVAALLVLAGCGGGGGGTVVAPETPPFANTAAAFWVSADGARWAYHLVDRRSGADPAPVLKTVTDLGEVVFGGSTVRRFDHSWSLFDREPETEYRRFDGRDIRAVVDLGADLGVPLAPQDLVEVPAPLVDGRSQTVLDRSEQFDVDGDAIPDAVRLSLRVTTARVATLSVPAGDFADLLHTRQEITATVTLAASGVSETATAVLATWYAPGVGVVKRVFEDPTEAAPANTVTEELVGFDVPGRRAGIVPAMTALDGIGAGTDSRVPQATALAVGQGSFMTVASTDSGSVEGAIHALDGSQIWRGTVLDLGGSQQVQALAVAFDGIDFRVVAASHAAFVSPSEWTLMAQRVGVDGTLRDGTAGTPLDTGISERSDSLTMLQAAGRDGRLLVAWARYDLTLVERAPGLWANRGYRIEGRLFGADQRPLAAQFELGAGLPAALALRDDQFVIVDTNQNGEHATLSAWAVGAVDGLAGPAQAISTTSDLKRGARLQMVGGELWLSHAERPDVGGPSASRQVVARLGRDGVLLDGTPSAPGRTLVPADAARGGGWIGLGEQRHLLAWVEGWNDLRATLFPSAVLTGTAALSATAEPLVPADPLAAGGPSRGLLWAGRAGDALLLAWLDNEQTASTPSDRVMFTLIHPRWTGP